MQNKVFNGIACAFVAIVVVALGVSAYGAFTGSDTSSTSASSSLEHGTITVQMKGLAFPDGIRTVAVGTKVVWTNHDGATHTVTATDKSFDSGRKDQGQTYEHIFGSIGKYDYICSIHPFMKGTITVVQPYGK